MIERIDLLGSRVESLMREANSQKEDVSAVKDEFNIELIDQKVKTSSLVTQIKKELALNPSLKSKVTNKVLNDIGLFLNLYKILHKELKFQFPEKKIEDAATLGINCIIILNTSLIKIKNNKIS